MTQTRRSETARPLSIIIEFERMQGVLIIAANTKALPRIDKTINGVFRTQIMTTFYSFSAEIKLKLLSFVCHTK